MAWFNNDGLRISTAGERRQYDGGEYPGAGPTRTIEWEVDLTSVPLAVSGAAGALTGIYGAPYVIVPRNSVIESVEVIAETAATSGGAAALNVGLVRRNGTTEIDYDGLVTALPLANINVTGEKNVFTAGQTNAGPLVGTETLFPGYLTVDYDTAAYTAGKLVIRINLYVKDKDLLPTNQ